MKSATPQNQRDRIGNPEDAAQALLEIARQLMTELRPRETRPVQVTLDSSLERDLGLDSLARVELMLRIERAFGVSMPEQLLASAETPRDLLRAVLSAGAAPQAWDEARFAALEKVETVARDAGTLADVLDWHARLHPDRPHIILYGAADKKEEITYANLLEGAEAVAAGLRERDIKAGQSVAIMLPTSRDYFVAFYGTLLAGGVPVPLYPAVRVSQIEDHLRHHAGILANALASILIAVPETKPFTRTLKLQVAGLQSVVTVKELSAAAGKPPRPALRAQDVALLQYTSGSTGNPKGVVLTHANLLANIRAMCEAVKADSTDVMVSWLPLYHDMGLIAGWLSCLYCACPFVAMPTLTFLARPERWLWAIHKHRATLSTSPNFGYELCLRNVEDRKIEGLDLSSWRLAFNAAEPISPETILRFQERFAKHGLRPQAMTPMYGLAESSAGLAFTPPGRGPIIHRIKRDAFTRSGRAEPADADESNALKFVACGRPLPGHQIRIVDAIGHETAEHQEGGLQFMGPSATSGYFRNPDATCCLFHGDWLDSGDLAYMDGDEVVVTGRTKDIIIRAGRNIYPHELEEAVGNIPGIRKGCVAVFGSADPASGTARLVVLAETRETKAEALEKLRSGINRVALDLIGMPPDDVMLSPPHTVLKTSSGKVRRAAAREFYKQGGAGERQPAIWRQYVRFAWAGVLPQLRLAMRALTDLLYAVYAWFLFALFFPIVWIMVAALPRPAWVFGKAAKLFLRLVRTPLFVHGLENLPRGRPSVLVANHASFLDGLVLSAILPGDMSYIAKQEFTRYLVSRVFLRRLGAEFVERFDFQRGLEDARRISNAAQAGRSLLFFPEGTFHRMAGLLPFHMGAFVIAAETGLPLVPVTIRGTRSMLREGEWFPRRGAVRVTIGSPILPEGTDWPAAIKLRDAARAEILRHCGEPDLA